jgi:hypothetical protein
MLVTEYFNLAVKQRSAAFRINTYLLDKNVDYQIYYNIDKSKSIIIGLENILKEGIVPELPKVFTSIMLKQYYKLGYFKDDCDIAIVIKGKNKEYKDIHDAFIINQNFVDEHHTLLFQEHYIHHLAEEVKKKILEIQQDEKLIEHKFYE